MAIVVSTTEIASRYQRLGWNSISIAETSEWLLESGINPGGFLAYLDALIAAPAGMNTDQLPGVDAGQLPYITDWLRIRGGVAV